MKQTVLVFESLNAKDLQGYINEAIDRTPALCGVQHITHTTCLMPDGAVLFTVIVVFGKQP